MRGGRFRFRFFTPVFVCATLVIALLQIVAPSAAGKNSPRSKLGRMWVVTGNVNEQRANDAHDHSDMRLFVSETIEQTEGAAPDVVLLQQVNQSSAKWIGNAFAKRTGSRFAVAVPPGSPTLRRVASQDLSIRDDSAILVNTSTSRVLAAGKTQVTQRPRAASRTPIRQIVPWAKVMERGKGADRLKMIAASIHYPKHSAFVGRPASHQHKARWSGSLNRFLGGKLPDAGVGDGRIPVLGGDFNAQKCRLGTFDSDGTCREMNFWRTLSRLRYRDAINMMQGQSDSWVRAIIDFLFTRANVSIAHRDGAPNYSDHGVAAALLEDEDTTPPWRPGRGYWTTTDKGHPCLWSFANGSSGWDGGSGLKKWVVYRSVTGGNDWELAGSITDRIGNVHFMDRHVTHSGNGQLKYKVAAVDRAGNASRTVPADYLSSRNGLHCRTEE